MIFYNMFSAISTSLSGTTGVIEVFDTRAMKRIQTVKTERGTHTMGFNPETQLLYALMPESQWASLFEDR